ncbi:uncharacterized protein BO96DRAFT_429999 [Aspergillus niger CBS 101883]|uniref:Uncharacterized protein n=2 Tax=Aspergillus niger TaxID=5061 RepID=A2R849_ASPNC|nr:uncharacterized protein BO96DRAFT_429999 [Aspergillus niger CBS 101883]XP_059604829.1 hypothetical protein An16g05830 [Aspergillus niger]PYH61400.1 hypothetical protein BO96DRAFT_429999 [Aspergillus niger CBS 101883]CAK46923.1 hypothetical protein An16g05830 [Aspergillus niger]
MGQMSNPLPFRYNLADLFIQQTNDVLMEVVWKDNIAWPKPMFGDLPGSGSPRGFRTWDIRSTWLPCVELVKTSIGVQVDRHNCSERPATYMISSTRSPPPLADTVTRLQILMKCAHAKHISKKGYSNTIHHRLVLNLRNLPFSPLSLTIAPCLLNDKCQYSTEHDKDHHKIQDHARFFTSPAALADGFVGQDCGRSGEVDCWHCELLVQFAVMLEALYGILEGCMTDVFVIEKQVLPSSSIGKYMTGDNSAGQLRNPRKVETGVRSVGMEGPGRG